MRIDLHSLQIFASVAANKSLSKAAVEMHLTPSAVSKRIADLESRMGVSLLVRHSTGVRLTAAGMVVAHHADDIMARVSAMTGEVSALLAGQQGEVRVMSNTTAILLGLLEDIEQFRRSHPGIHVVVTEGGSYEVLESVKRNAADIGVCVKVDGLRGLVHERYRQTGLDVIAPRAHVLASRPALTLDDLRSYRIVWTPPVGMLTGSCLEAPEPDVGLSVRSFDVVLRSVHEGAGLAVVPHVVVASALPDALVAVPLDLPDGVFEVVVSFKPGAQSGPAIRQLFEWLHSRSGHGCFQPSGEVRPESWC